MNKFERLREVASLENPMTRRKVLKGIMIGGLAVGLESAAQRKIRPNLTPEDENRLRICALAGAVSGWLALFTMMIEDRNRI